MKKPFHLVHNNRFSDNEKVQSFKAIIQESLYPDDLMSYSISSIAITKKVLEAFNKTGGSKRELIDLMLFSVECGSQFAIDWCDFEEEYYTAVENLFDEVLILLKEPGDNLFNVYKHRIHTIICETRYVGYGFGEQLANQLTMHFPKFFEDGASSDEI